METIQVVLDKELLRAVDRMALQQKRNLSAFVRDAFRDDIRRLEICSLERSGREGYSKQPQSLDESLAREAEAV